MQVEVDEVWASPSTLHVRVIVHADDRRWRHKYYCSVPLDEIPEEAFQQMLLTYRDENHREELQDIPLF